MDLTDSRGCTYVSAQILGRIYPSWPWQNDATVVHDYAILMMMMLALGALDLLWRIVGGYAMSAVYLSFILPVCHQDYCKSNQLISLKLVL